MGPRALILPPHYIHPPPASPGRSTQVGAFNETLRNFTVSGGDPYYHYTGCSEMSCKFLRLVTQSFFGLFPVFWAFLYYKLWAIFHSSTSGT